MTTTVIVKAHCAKEKEVVIAIGNEKTGENIRIQDGEEWSGVIYDDRSVYVKEKLKAED